MFLAATILLSIVALAADYRFFRRHVAPHAGPAGRRLFLAAAVVTDLLPFLVSGIVHLLPDNTTGCILAIMWGLFATLVTVLPRLTWYLFLFMGDRCRLALRTPLRLCGAAAAVAVAALLIGGVTRGRTHLVVREVTVRSERIPAAFDGFRIVQFSDLHLGTLLRPAREMQRLADTIRALRPDLVVFSGDLVNIRYTELDTTAMRILGSIDAPCGVVSVTGNHDIGYYIRDSLRLPKEENLARLLDRQRAMGWRILDDTTEYLVRGDDSIALSGIPFDVSLRNFRHAHDLPETDLSPAYRGVPHGIYNITVAHLPQLWDKIRELGYGDLTLSGHVHAMQVKLPAGRGLSPAQLFYPRWSGGYEEQGRLLYINDGIGCVGFPMRLGAPPEITLFILRP